MSEILTAVFSGIITKILGDKWSSNKESRKAKNNLQSYITHLSDDIDDVTINAYELWENSFKYTEFKLYFKNSPKILIPKNFDDNRIQKYLDACGDELNENLRITVSALIRHIGKYHSLRNEMANLEFELDERKCYLLYIETLYIRKYIITMVNSWPNVPLLTADNHTHESLTGSLNLPVNINDLTSKVIREFGVRT
ncbi:hypothetical protein PVK62_17415 [Aliivibrio sp. S3MY1]|uniref:hypothetical protein n=1 Tax=unclassified Aliivibrio TaxID=2645654 RepID=UPI0023799B2E|nr:MULTISPECIES: hypothetical protein [unclassified Aliivibrio]MDD9197597.1 hypothetical protein [Aliivibrio sp. S3MY1]MDD9200848.1 hypothetical protein [Aliivibrio sp. S2MY1]